MSQSLDSDRILFHDSVPHGTRIKVISVGAGGNNALNRMVDASLQSVDFISVNTNGHALKSSKASVRLQLGAQLTRGMGTRGDPGLGRRVALDDSGLIIEALEEADMVFIVAGLGGGTGTGAAPVIASLASQMGALTIAAVTLPFGFEGRRRMKAAERGIQELLDSVDTLIVIPNEGLLAAAKDKLFFQSFHVADDALRHAVQGIAEIVTNSGVINRDVADVRTTLSGMGHAVMGTAARSGANRAVDAAVAALASPLIESGAVHRARGILINIAGSSSLKLGEVEEASKIIRSIAHEDVDIIFGAVLDESLGAEVRVTLIVCGLQPNRSGGTEPQAREHTDKEAESTIPITQIEDLTARRSRVKLKGGTGNPDSTADAVSPKGLDQVESRSRIQPQPAALKAAAAKPSPRFQVGSPAASTSAPPPERDSDPAALVAEEPSVAVHPQMDWPLDDIVSPTGPSSKPLPVSPVEGAVGRSPNGPVPTPLASLRQAAIAAYAAASMPKGAEVEETPTGHPDGFAAILESRLELAGELDPHGFGPEMAAAAASGDGLFPELSDEPFFAAIEDAPSPDLTKDSAPAGDYAWTSEPFRADARGTSSPIELFNSPVFRTSVSLDSHGPSDIKGLPPESASKSWKPRPETLISESGRKEVLRDGRDWPPGRSDIPTTPTFPSFASGSPAEGSADEFDELDIPAFLRRGD